MPLWLVRHAQPVVAAGVCYGWADVGAHEAPTLATARALAEVLPPGASVWTSPLQRCQQLALALNRLRPDLAPWVHPGLMEACFGGWEAQPWERLGAAVVQSWADDLWAHAPGGGEPLCDVVARVQDLWRLAWQDPGRAQVWLTHAGVLRVARMLHAGLAGPVTASQWPRTTLPFGAVIRLDGPGSEWPA